MLPECLQGVEDRRDGRDSRRNGGLPALEPASMAAEALADAAAETAEEIGKPVDHHRLAGVVTAGKPRLAPLDPGIFGHPLES